MSGLYARFRILAITVVFSVGALLAGCSEYAGDAGADRSQQQSEQLQKRIKTTQIDR
jgi:hypothetical protein